MDQSVPPMNGESKESNELPVTRKNGKLPECYDQALFDAKMNASEIMFSADLPRDNEALFSTLGSTPITSKKETMESPASAVAAASVESPPVGTPGTYGNANLTFVSCDDKNAVPSTTRKKRKHPSEEHDEIKVQLYSLLESNSRVLAAHIESQNLNSQLDRNQRKEHAENLVSVLSKLADAMEKIAEKL